MNKYEVMNETTDNWLKDRPRMAENNTPERVSNLLIGEAEELLQAVIAHSFANSPESIQEVKQEIADVMVFLLSLCNIYDVDLFTEFMDKMAYNYIRYPSCLFNNGNTYEEGRAFARERVVYQNIKGEYYKNN